MANIPQKYCAICHQYSNDVKRLPCTHIFCEECLRRHLINGGHDRVGYFSCPVCKLGISVPLGGLRNLSPLFIKPPRQHNARLENPLPAPNPLTASLINQVPQLSNPTSVSCTSDNHVVISDKHNSSIFIYDLQGKLVSCFSIKEKISSCIYTNFNSLFISNGDFHAPLVVEYSLGGKRLVSRPMLNKMETTHGICLLSEPRQIVVSSVETFSLYVVGDSGKLVSRINGKGLLGHPYHIASTHNNDIVISDHLNHCIKILDRDGKLKNTISSVGTGEHNLYEPMGVVVEGSNILVADSGNRCVKSFRTSGKFNSTLFQSRSPEQPIGVALTRDGESLVVLLVGGVYPRFVVRNYKDLASHDTVSCV